MDAVSKVAPYYQQLLGRSPLAVEDPAVSTYLSKQRILVTGAGGSIGSALSNALLRIRPRELVLVEHHENSLFQLHQRLSSEAARIGLPTHFALADVRDIRTIGSLLQTFRPDVVFHLAAYKHVPLAEQCPAQFVSVNVVGAWHLCQEAARVGVKKIVYPSTDKAVNPPSVYGATKRSVELLLESLSTRDTQTQFSVARLVNVLGACGGVIESFFQQITSGSAVRVTDSRMTRYWITMDETLYLLSQAARIDGRFKTVLLDLGEPVKVEDIALKLWRLLRPQGEECRIEHIGIRPGERLSEELFLEHERPVPTPYAHILEVSKNVPVRYSLAEAESYVGMMEQLIAENAHEQIKEQLFAFVRG